MADNGEVNQRRGRRAGATTDGMALWARLSGVVVATAGWLALVGLAVDFGRRARAGDGLAWVPLTLATVGATICLVAGVTLALRALALAGLLSTYEPKRARRD